MSTHFHKIIRRIRYQGVRKTLFYLFGLCLGKCAIRINRIYRLPDQISLNRLEEEIQNKYTSLAFSICSQMEDFSEEDIQSLCAYEENLTDPSGFPKLFQRKMSCAIARINGKLGGYCWFAKSPYPLPKQVPPECLKIQMCNTFPEFRGQGVYPGILNYACWLIRQLNPDYPIVIKVSVFNDSSIRGIEKAHFRQLGYWFSLPLPFYRKTFHWSLQK